MAKMALCECGKYVYEYETCECGRLYSGTLRSKNIQKGTPQKKESILKEAKDNRSYKTLDWVGGVNILLGQILFAIFIFVGVIFFIPSLNASFWIAISQLLGYTLIGFVAYILFVQSGEIIFLFINIAKDIEKIKNKK
tara:strand:- start:68 stop:481 length:414 start_codon:yes stop_codon:yes gene_type:complete